MRSSEKMTERARDLLLALIEDDNAVRVARILLGAVAAELPELVALIPRSRLWPVASL